MPNHLLSSGTDCLPLRFGTHTQPRTAASAWGQSVATSKTVKTINRKISTIQTVDTRELIASWHRINSTIAAGMRSKIGVMKRQHLELFDPAERLLASKVFDAAVVDLTCQAAHIRAAR